MEEGKASVELLFTTVKFLGANFMFTLQELFLFLSLFQTLQPQKPR